MGKEKFHRTHFVAISFIEMVWNGTHDFNTLHVSGFLSRSHSCTYMLCVLTEAYVTFFPALWVEPKTYPIPALSLVGSASWLVSISHVCWFSGPSSSVNCLLKWPFFVLISGNHPSHSSHPSISLLHILWR